MNFMLVKSSWLIVPKNEILQCSYYTNNGNNVINTIVSLAVFQAVYVFDYSNNLLLIRSKQSTDKRRILSFLFADEKLLNR